MNSGNVSLMNAALNREGGGVSGWSIPALTFQVQVSRLRRKEGAAPQNKADTGRGF